MGGPQPSRWQMSPLKVSLGLSRHTRFHRPFHFTSSIPAQRQPPPRSCRLRSRGEKNTGVRGFFLPLAAPFFGFFFHPEVGGKKKKKPTKKSPGRVSAPRAGQRRAPRWRPELLAKWGRKETERYFFFWGGGDPAAAPAAATLNEGTANEAAKPCPRHRPSVSPPPTPRPRTLTCGDEGGSSGDGDGCKREGDKVSVLRDTSWSPVAGLFFVGAGGKRWFWRFGSAFRRGKSAAGGKELAVAGSSVAVWCRPGFGPPKLGNGDTSVPKAPVPKLAACPRGPEEEDVGPCRHFPWRSKSIFWLFFLSMNLLSLLLLFTPFNENKSIRATWP